MKKITGIFIFFFPLIVYAQVVIKAGAAVGNRWNETVTGQALGKGFRLSVEKPVLPQFSVGLGISYLSFHPNKSVVVRFNSYSLQCVYWFNTKNWQPYLGAGVGYTRYADKTTINPGTGTAITQARNKNYGVIDPFLGLQYSAGKNKKAGIFFQLNADFVPILNIQPIGFVSVATGISYRLH